MVDMTGCWVLWLAPLTAHTMYPPSLWELTLLFPLCSQARLSSCCGGNTEQGGGGSTPRMGGKGGDT